VRLAVSGRLAVEERRGRYGANVPVGRHFDARAIDSAAGSGWVRSWTIHPARAGAPSVARQPARGPSNAAKRVAQAVGEDEERWRAVRWTPVYRRESAVPWRLRCCRGVVQSRSRS